MCVSVYILQSHLVVIHDSHTVHTHCTVCPYLVATAAAANRAQKVPLLRRGHALALAAAAAVCLANVRMYVSLYALTAMRWIRLEAPLAAAAAAAAAAST